MLTIAIIDDDASHSRAFARLLRASGMLPVTYSSAEEYLARRNGTLVDCLVLDVQLGGMSGLELQSFLAANPASPPIVFLTAHGEAELVAQILSTGCAYVRKTDPGQVLLEAIRQAVAARAILPTSGSESTL
jgi:FixJ family two-component response regulator